MAFQQNFNGGNSNQTGDKKKTNFPVGRLFGSDAVMNISVWNSDSAVYTILSIKQAVGKDPSTGANVYEQKAPNELPRVFLNPENLRAFIERAKDIDQNNINFTLPLKNGSKATVVGSATGQIKITLETEKQGSRTVTFEAIPVGSTSINASWKNMIALLDVAMKKALYAKLDPEEFATALGASSSEEELPI
jgi:hypothetical protein